MLQLVWLTPQDNYMLYIYVIKLSLALDGHFSLLGIPFNVRKSSSIFHSCSSPFCSRTSCTYADGSQNTSLHSCSNKADSVGILHFPLFGEMNTHSLDVDFSIFVKDSIASGKYGVKCRTSCICCL